MKYSKAFILASGLLLANASSGFEEISLKLGVNGNFLNRKLRVPGDSSEREKKFYIGPAASLALSNDWIFFEVDSSLGIANQEKGKNGGVKAIAGIPVVIGDARFVPYAGFGVRYMSSVEKAGEVGGANVAGGKVKNKVFDHYIPFGFFVDFEQSQDLKISPFVEYHLAIKSKDKHRFKLDPDSVGGEIDRESKGSGYSLGFQISVNQFELKPFVTFWNLREKHITSKIGTNFNRESTKSKERRLESGIRVSYSF